MSQLLFDYLNKLYPISEAIQTKLDSILKKKAFKKKEYLLQIGQMSNHIYFIEKGLVRICYKKDDEDVCSGLLCEGQFPLSVKSFFRRITSYEFIQALEETNVSYIHYNELENLYQEFIEFNVVGRLLFLHHYMLSEDRTELLRKQTAKEKFEIFQQTLGHLVPRVPRRDVASYLGINLETLSRLGY